MYSIEFDGHILLKTWQEFYCKLLEDPNQSLNAQLSYWQDYLSLCNKTNNALETKSDGLLNQTPVLDKRFQHAAWNENELFKFLMESYLLTSQHIKNWAKNTARDNTQLAMKLEFYAQQFVNIISPANTIYTNPEVIQETLLSNGENLRTGFKKLLHDLEIGDGTLSVPTTDLEYFTLGENLAISKGKVIYQNDLIQLIQYEAMTEKVHRIPLLIIPPWVNKYYILDLQPENSFVRWLVAQGYSVFLISWVNPNQIHAQKKFSDYLLEGPLAALEIINKATGVNKINALGYCIGGTLLACMLAYLATQKKQNVISATFLTTLLDFSQPGELGMFIDAEQINVLEQHMQKKGYLEGKALASVFSSLRSNDLIWANFVQLYLKGKKLPPFDLLYWNSDSTNIPEKVHTFYLREMYLRNRLIKPNKIKLNGIPLNLGKITQPCYFLATQTDHIIPWTSSFNALQYLSGPNKFVLGGSGHVAGVINPPAKNKYGYWTNSQSLSDPNQWFNSAEYHQGSWWVDWANWLIGYAGSKIPARVIGKKYAHIIEDAPGSYVKVHV